MEALIAFLTGLLVFFIIELVLDFLLGDRGKEGQIKLHYIKLRGEHLETQTQLVQENVGIIEEIGIKNKKKYQKLAVVGSASLFLVSLYLFGSIFISMILTLGGLYIPTMLKRRDEIKRTEIIQLQFRDALNAIMASLKSGMSMNSAIIKTPEDIEKIHEVYKEKVILEEFRKMKNDLLMGIPLDAVLISFKERLKFEEVNDFVNSIIILKKKGGNLVDVMENTIVMITDKMALKNEIKVLTAQKKAEAKLLTFMPIIVVIGLSVFMPDYVSPLFDSILGQILCLIAFGMLLGNFVIGKKITNIEA